MCQSIPERQSCPLQYIVILHFENRGNSCPCLLDNHSLKNNSNNNNNKNMIYTIRSDRTFSAVDFYWATQPLIQIISVPVIKEEGVT